MTRIYLITIIIFSSCAAMQEQWVADNCDTDSAYSLGVQHAQNGQEHDTTSYSLCDKSKRGVIKKSYSKGFSSVGNNPVNLIKDAIGLNYYTCELSPFTKTFTSSGKNLGKVRVSVKAKCMAENNEMHCDEFKCRKN